MKKEKSEPITQDDINLLNRKLKYIRNQITQAYDLMFRLEQRMNEETGEKREDTLRKYNMKRSFIQMLLSEVKDITKIINRHQDEKNIPQRNFNKTDTNFRIGFPPVRNDESNDESNAMGT